MPNDTKLPTPRAIVAGAGELIVVLSVFGDANDNCTFGAEDPLYTQKYLAGQETPTAAQLANMDAYPDGDISVADALFESQILARLTHFAALEVASPTASGGIADLLVTVTDRDQVRVTSDLRVLAEVKVDQGFNTLTFDNPKGVGEDPNTKLGEATHEGNGVYRIQILGLNDPTTVYVTVLLSTLDPSDSSVIKTIAIIGSAENQGTFSAWTSFGVPLGGSNQCFNDSDCAAGFFCDDTAGPGSLVPTKQCQPKKADGEQCPKTTACVANHCQNGFCCASGDCCDVASSCPTSYTVAATCQMRRSAKAIVKIQRALRSSARRCL